MEKEFSMKNFAKFLGIAVIVAVIGLSMASCAEEEEGKDALDGTTWRATDDGVTYVITFNNPDFSMTMTDGGEKQTMKGTYKISGSTVTLTMDGDDVTGTLSGDKLTIEGITFTKQ